MTQAASAPRDDNGSGRLRQRVVLFAGLAQVLLVVNVAWLFGLYGPVGDLPDLLVFLLSDAAFGLLIAGVILAVQRRNGLALLLAGAVPAILLSASWTKLALLGTSALFADVVLLQDLYLAVPVAWRVAGLAVLCALALAFVANLRIRAALALGLAASGLVLAVGAQAGLAEAGAARLATLLPPRFADFPHRGHFLQAVSVGIEDLEWRAARVTDEAESLPRRLPPDPVLASPRRDLHILVLESFADPRSLPVFGWSAEPLTPLLVRWREETRGQAVTPVFANRSSNTEFEVLCGLPALAGRSGMVFGRIPDGARLDCLPRILARQGYRTASLVPSGPGIFWAGRAFAAMGFERALFEHDLDMSDLDGTWLSAEATLLQVLALREALGDGAPRLVYAFVNAGHYPYERDRAKRPDRVSATPRASLVEAWANAVHHTALAVEAHVAQVSRDDPDALIVILGDHNPPLGSNLGGYRTGGRIPPDEAESPLTRAYMYRTPLLVLDRGRLVPTGDLPTWHLPHLLLDLLSEGESCAEGTCPHRAAIRLRPLPGLVLALDEKGAEMARCPWGRDVAPAAAQCAEAIAESEDLHRALRRFLSGSAP